MKLPLLDHVVIEKFHKARITLMCAVIFFQIYFSSTAVRLVTLSLSTDGQKMAFRSQNGELLVST